jgi:hypothetical protein
MGRPPFDRLRAHFGALLAASLRAGGFRTFAPKPQNGFAAVTNVAGVCRAGKFAADVLRNAQALDRSKSPKRFEMKKN